MLDVSAFMGFQVTQSSCEAIWYKLSLSGSKQTKIWNTVILKVKSLSWHLYPQKYSVKNIIKHLIINDCIRFPSLLYWDLLLALSCYSPLLSCFIAASSTHSGIQSMKCWMLNTYHQSQTKTTSRLLHTAFSKKKRQYRWLSIILLADAYTNS